MDIKVVYKWNEEDPSISFLIEAMNLCKGFDPSWDEKLKDERFKQPSRRAYQRISHKEEFTQKDAKDLVNYMHWLATTMRIKYQGQSGDMAESVRQNAKNLIDAAERLQDLVTEALGARVFEMVKGLF